MEIFEMEKEFDELMKKSQELIKKLKKEQVDNASKTKRWRPKKGEEYWYFENEGSVFLTVNDEGEYDGFLKTIGNCFKSKEEAEKELERRVAESELLDLCDDGGVVEIRFDIDNGEFCAIGEDSDYSFSPYRFESEESCEKAIEQLGTEKLKLIFRID